jgi:nicotinate phosphoribosyltransferase
VLHSATERDVKEGKTADVYFSRTLEILKAKKADKRVKAEFTAKKLPCEWPWGVLAGIEECVEVLKNLKVSVRAMKEGTIFYPYQPVLELEGMYSDFGLYETALLGLICQASGISTKAARCKKLAGERKVISFGARRMHPTLAPMIERSAYLGGCDGVAVAKSAELIDEEPVGTMPHALILILEDTVEALKVFHEVIDPKVRRVVLVDTLGDEKFEAIRAAEALGRDLYAVRLDTPASRRGSFLGILQEVRWELDLRGYKHVRLFVSGGINETDIPELNPLADAYGIGTSVSNAPVIDFAMDIIEVEGRPFAKRGKLSGAKRVLRCPSCHHYEIIPLNERKTTCPGLTGSGQVCGASYEDLLVPLMEKGKLFSKMPSAKAIRGYVLNQMRFLEI